MMRRARGFTLIEVLAAFSVLALGIAIVVSLLNGGRRQVRYAAEASYAAQFARGLLDSQGLVSRLREGSDEGQSDDEHMRWTLEIKEIPDPLAPEDGRLAPGAGADEPGKPGDADTQGDPGNADKPGTPPGKTAATTVTAEDVVEPLQLMHLQLDLEWGHGGPRERARFTTLRTQMRPPDDGVDDVVPVPVTGGKR
ncbi:MAG: type II secretion system protein [Xanthomonadaceae bacterium]|nr:type II secretion system protein [Xanthomonadaceae bacterium]